MREPQLTLPAAYLVMAFRYALGRRSYVTGEVADELVAQAPNLRPDQRTQIVRDIDDAIARGHAGAECDVAEWRKAREVLADLDPRPVPGVVALEQALHGPGGGADA